MTPKEHFSRAVIFGTIAEWLKDKAPAASKEFRDRAVFEVAKGIDALALSLTPIPSKLS